MNLVVSSPCETEPCSKGSLYITKIFIGLKKYIFEILVHSNRSNEPGLLKVGILENTNW